MPEFGREIFRGIETLLERTATCKQYDIIQYLEKMGVFAEFGQDSANVQLYKKNFVAMHILYSLKKTFAERGRLLKVSPILIELEDFATADSLTSSDSAMPIDAAVQEVRDNALADYYLNWEHYDQANEETVTLLLDQFWDKYFALDKREQALACLQLGQDADWATIQMTYRKKIAQLHPDKGGNSQEFIAVRDAYLLLKTFYAERSN